MAMAVTPASDARILVLPKVAPMASRSHKMQQHVRFHNSAGHGVSTPHDMIAPQRGELLKRPPSVSWQGIGIEAQPVVQL